MKWGSTEEATAALESRADKPIWAGGPALRLDYGANNQAATQRTTTPTTNLYIGNIGRQTVADLRELFEDFDIKDVRIS